MAAAAVFALALLFDLADISSDAFNFQTLITVGLLLMALHLGGVGTSTNWRRGRSSSRNRR